MKLKISTILMLAMACCFQLKAQKVAVKTNLLYDLTTTANAGVEIGLAPKWTFDLSGNFNAWSFSDNKKWKQLTVQPEWRYWPCERFNGHFFGAHLLGGIYNVGGINAGFKFLGTDFRKLKENRYEGWRAGAGIAYGYHWMLSRHWSMEAEAGFGYVFTMYDRYECAECGERLEKNATHNYVGPTKAAINLIYVF